jgi:hypothetical protein
MWDHEKQSIDRHIESLLHEEFCDLSLKHINIHCLTKMYLILIFPPPTQQELHRQKRYVDFCHISESRDGTLGQCLAVLFATPLLRTPSCSKIEPSRRKKSLKFYENMNSFSNIFCVDVIIVFLVHTINANFTPFYHKPLTILTTPGRLYKWLIHSIRQEWLFHTITLHIARGIRFLSTQTVHNRQNLVLEKIEKNHVHRCIIRNVGGEWERNILGWVVVRNWLVNGIISCSRAALIRNQ